MALSNQAKFGGHSFDEGEIITFSPFASTKRKALHIILI